MPARADPARSAPRAVPGPAGAVADRVAQPPRHIRKDADEGGDVRLVVPKPRDLVTQLGGEALGEPFDLRAHGARLLEDAITQLGVRRTAHLLELDVPLLEAAEPVPEIGAERLQLLAALGAVSRQLFDERLELASRLGLDSDDLLAEVGAHLRLFVQHPLLERLEPPLDGAHLS